MKRWVSALVLAAAVLALGAGCSSGRAPGDADLALTGRARLTTAKGDKVTVLSSQMVRRGDTVDVTRGSAVLHFADDRSIELRKGSSLRIDRVPTLLRGDALVLSGRTRFDMHAAGSRFSIASGVARVSRQLGVDVATYDGSLSVSSAGNKLVVPALRQATIPTLGILPPRVAPMRLRATDPWDRRYLGEAIELTEQLQSRSDGLTGQLRAGAGRGADFLTDVLPALATTPGFDASMVDTNRAPGETVVGAGIALEGSLGRFSQRWVDAFGFRDQGAAWGLVALDQRVKQSGRLTEALDAALAHGQSRTLELAAPPVVATPEPDAPAVAAPASATRPVPTTPAKAGATATTTPPASGGDTTTAEPTPLVQGVTDTVGGVVSGLLHVLTGK
jgi:hypothetical protein